MGCAASTTMNMTEESPQEENRNGIDNGKVYQMINHKDSSGSKKANEDGFIGKIMNTALTDDEILLR